MTTTSPCPVGEEPDPAQDERAHQELAQLGVGLEERSQARVLDAEDAQPPLRAAAHERAAVGEHGHLAGELVHVVNGDRLLGRSPGMNDLELALEDDVERDVAVALLEDDVAVLESLLDAERGHARHLLGRERREHLRAPRLGVERVRNALHDGSLRRKELIVGVAISPRLADLARSDDGVLRGAKVRRCVPVRRVVAAADVAAGQADPQMNPPSADGEAVFAARGRPMRVSRRFGRDVRAGVREIDAIVGFHRATIGTQRRSGEDRWSSQLNGVLVAVLATHNPTSYAGTSEAT